MTNSFPRWLITIFFFPFGPSEVRTTVASFLHASMLRSTAASKPLMCVVPYEQISEKKLPLTHAAASAASSRHSRTLRARCHARGHKWQGTATFWRGCRPHLFQQLQQAARLDAHLLLTAPHTRTRKFFVQWDWRKSVCSEEALLTALFWLAGFRDEEAGGRIGAR